MRVPWILFQLEGLDTYLPHKIYYFVSIQNEPLCEVNLIILYKIFKVYAKDMVSFISFQPTK